MSTFRHFAVPALLLAVLTTFAGAAAANDSTARLDATGIRLQPNYAIRMETERLEISRDRITVDYTFRNTLDWPERSLVAFPLPEIAADLDVPYAIDPADPVNFVDFRLWVDGRPVTPDVEIKALVNGVDMTGVLARYDVPVSRFADDFEARLNALPDSALDALATVGAVDVSAGGYVRPLWSMKVTFYWMQVFPPGETVSVRHVYTPVPGAFIHAGGMPDELVAQYCMTDGFVRAVDRLIDTTSYKAVTAYDLRYILTTANNWQGPIGAFELTIDKGEPTSLVSLCIDDIDKVAPTRFTFSARDYVPAHDLDILFVVDPEAAP